MSIETKITKSISLIKKKSRGYEATITYTGNYAIPCRDFFFKSYDRGHTYDLYNGCELVVGDSNLRKCVIAMLDLCNEFHL